jgi:hypothetical protein
MTQETIKSLTDNELPQLIAWAQDEIRSRAERRKEEAIAKIKALAESVGVKIAIGGVRGRPARIKPKPSVAKSPQTA